MTDAQVVLHQQSDISITEPVAVLTVVSAGGKYDALTDTRLTSGTVVVLATQVCNH